MYFTIADSHASDYNVFTRAYALLDRDETAADHVP